jgi:hypothetical protein
MILNRLGVLVLLVGLGVGGLSTAKAEEPVAKSLRDGQHDFDFNFGVWHTHITRILDPLSGSSKTMELDGTVTVRKVWGGRAQLEEIEADGPNGHWEGLTLFLYNPQSHQWSQTFIDARAGELTTPLIGEFKEGRGELFSGDTFNGKSILVRGVWSVFTPDSHRYEESYSEDGGKTWSSAFIGNLTRERQAAEMDTAPVERSGDSATAGDDAHAFDFDFGVWQTHSSRLMHPLTGSTTWVNLDGSSVVKKVWAGRANLAEYQADSPSGHLELLALRWYNPAAHQWNIDFATPNVGMLGAVPGVGAYKNGRLAFYDQETINGRSVLVRFEIWGTGADTAQSEQAFSADGGKTWEVNWVNKYARAKQ